MKTKQAVVLDLRPGHLDLVLFDGPRRIDARRVELDPEDDPAEWAGVVGRAAGPLRELIEELEVAGEEARVLFRSPTHSIELTSLAVRSPAQAVAAARMSATDALAYSAMTAVCAAVVAGHDAEGEPPQTHVVTAVDREDVLAAIVSLVEDSGLRFAFATPIEAAVIAGFVGEVLHETNRHGGTLYLGVNTSLFVVASRGTILFSRRIDLGLESIASSLTRPLNLAGRSEPIELSLEEARGLLHRHGVPDRDTAVDEIHGLTGVQVIPLMQPVLQRVIIELRQSLRFGVSEGDRENLTLRLSGPGAALPRLAEVIGDELGVETRADPSYRDAGKWWEPGPALGELTDALRSVKHVGPLSLLPRPLAARRRRGGLRRWMMTGTAAALVLIALDGVRHHLRVQTARAQAEAYAAQLGDLTALESTRQQLSVVMGAKNTLRQTIHDRVGLIVDHRVCLHELSRITPPDIRFTEVGFDDAVGGARGRLIGFALAGETGEGRSDLESFIGRLQDSPLFTAVKLGNVQMGAAGDANGDRFTATFRVVPAPREGVAAVAGAEGGRER